MRRRRGSRRNRAALAAGLALLLASCAGLATRAEEAILTLAVDPAVLEVAPGGKVEARVVVRNSSPYAADDVEFLFAGPGALALDRAPDSVKVVDAFGTTSVRFALRAADGAADGEITARFEVIYTYCIGDLCFQILEDVPLTVRVGALVPSSVAAGADVEGPPAEPSASVWPWAVFAAAALLSLAAAIVRTDGRARVALSSALGVAALAALGLGVWLGQHTQAQAVGAVLCTSCVGIEVAETGTPRLSSAQAATVDRLDRPIDLLVFYAPWCRSCPYAEAMVELIASRNPLVSYRFVNADVERDLAIAHGVTRGGRTVVPAVVRLDTGEVVFGAEDLARRLLGLLTGEEP